MRNFLIACLGLGLVACGGVRTDLPPVEERSPESLAQKRDPIVIPSEDGAGARNPDDPFVMAEIGADLRVGALHAAGVFARNANAQICLDKLQVFRRAKIGLEELPAACATVDLRLFGAGADRVRIPPPPEPKDEAPDAAPDEGAPAEQGFWDRVFSHNLQAPSIFG